MKLKYVNWQHTPVIPLFYFFYNIDAKLTIIVQFIIVISMKIRIATPDSEFAG